MKYSFNNSLIVPNKFQCEVVDLAKSKKYTLSDIAKQKNTYKKHVLRIVHKFIEKEELAEITISSYKIRNLKLATLKSTIDSINNKRICKTCEKTISVKKKEFCSKICKNKYNYNVWEKRPSYFKEGSRVLKTLLKEKDGYKCKNCGIFEWQGKKISLQMDHIDGNYTNNSVGNLRFLCPNCHSQTDTYGSKNKGNGRSYRRKIMGS